MTVFPWWKKGKPDNCLKLATPRVRARRVFKQSSATCTFTVNLSKFSALATKAKRPLSSRGYNNDFRIKLGNAKCK